MRIGVLVKVMKHHSMLAMAHQAGYDFVLLDNEHGFFASQELHDMCMYANSMKIMPMVRISEISKTEIGKTLDAGAKGLLVPMVESKEEVDQLVKLAYYPSLGARGYAGGANTDYQRGLKHREVIAEANQSLRLYVQLETKLGVEHAAEIVCHPNIHGVVIGPADLAISLGHPGDYLHESQISVMKEIARLCQINKKEFGIIGNVALLEMFRGETDFMVSAIDVDLVYQGLQENRKNMNKVISTQ